MTLAKVHRSSGPQVIRVEGDFEYVCCDLCGQDDTRLLYHTRDTLDVTDEVFNLVQCRHCGLAYLNPRPTRESIGRYYSAEYFCSFSSAALPTGRLRIFIKRVHSWLIGSLEHRVLALSPGRVLDVGCGDGRYLELLRALGWQTCGVDPSEVAIRSARARGLDVFHGELLDAGLPDSQFDLVVLRYTLENMHNPSEVLREVWRVLAKDGRVFVAVPPMDSLVARLFTWRSAYIDSPRHLYLFTAPTVSRLLEQAGFRLERLTTVPVSHLRDVTDRMSRGRLKKLLRNRWFSRALYAAEFPFTVLFGWLRLNRGNVEILARKIAAARESSS